MLQQQMLQQTFLQQQYPSLQQLQQLQSLQRMQELQQMQTVVLKRQMLDLVRQGPKAIRPLLQDPQEDRRLLGAITAGKAGPALTDDLIPLLIDNNGSIRQAARRSLVSLSTWRDGKPGSRRSVDFGPSPSAGPAAQQAAALKWQAWLDRQQVQTAQLEGTTARPSR
jgi:hypothetical protein